MTGFKQSRISPKHYFEWRRKRAYPPVKSVNEKINLKNKYVLDIGCGYGALSSILLQHGAQVWATEVDSVKLNFAREQLGKNKNFSSFLVKDEVLPVEKDFFDAVFIFDVIEHVRNPGKTLEEIERVLKPGGYLYVEFTPYYSITGHHLYDFAKWPIHILPREKIRQIVYSKKIKGFMTQEYYWKQFESLNKLRISEFQRRVKMSSILTFNSLAILKANPRDGRYLLFSMAMTVCLETSSLSANCSWVRLCTAR